ncbi:MAG TPA: RDD family protein [Steroidobacteraceae bacterium]|nr:RDD family protein [Steroidobacteraceae bacterium]
MATENSNPYASPKAPVADVVSSEPFELAERGARLQAAVIDGLTVLIPLIPTFVLWYRVLGHRAESMTGVGLLGPLAGLGALAVIGVAIYDCVLLSRNGWTIGKRLSGIKIVRTDGTKASLGRIIWLRGFVNGLLGAIPFVGRLYSLADILFIFGKARRCIHDYIADTLVVKA